MYFTALSNRLHTASSVHLGSNTAKTSVGSTVRDTPFSAALGRNWAAADSSMGASSKGRGFWTMIPVSSREAFTRDCTRSWSFSAWPVRAATWP